MSAQRVARRFSRAAVFVLGAAVLASVPMSAAAVPAHESGQGASPGCAPATRPLSVDPPMTRLRRADDQPSYTLREVRRIDRRLDRALAHKDAARLSGGGFGLVLRVPVRAHTLDGSSLRGPSKRAVKRQIAVLNRAYDGGQSRANPETHFQFYLESFDRTRNQRWFAASLFDPADRQLRKRLHRGGPESLNLYFSAPRSPQSDAVVLGWSSVPWNVRRHPKLDGVTIHLESMPGGALSRYNGGDTAVHEVGHWLGLFHTFEGGCSAQNDLVEDTPAEAEPSMGCEAGRDTCPGGGPDPIHNFMDYSVDSCMNMFTPGQVARMTDNWLAYRTP